MTVEAVEPLRKEFRPQKGPQEKYLATDVDIAFFGGAAGGGKTYATLLDILRFHRDANFGATVFRRQTTDLKQEGGIWDESEMMYPYFGATGYAHKLLWRFPSGATVKFAHMEHEKTRLTYQGAQIQYIAFEELTQFTAKQFWYLLSRNRSPTGGRCYMRATMNPDPDSFVRILIDWWIDKDGYAIPERSGVVRWFIRVRDKLEWADNPEELRRVFGKRVLPQSFTFIASKIEDNPILLENNPQYLARLESLAYVEKEQLLKGNWNVRAAAGLVFKRSMFDIVDVAPLQGRTARYWDRAGTPKTDLNDPDAWAGVKIRKAPDGFYYVLHVEWFHAHPFDGEARIKATAAQDGKKNCDVLLAGDPASAGKFEAAYYVKALASYNVKSILEREDILIRANPVAAQCGARNVKLVRGPWNEAFLRELENFPEGAHDDQVSAFCGAMNDLMRFGSFGFTPVTKRTGDTATARPGRVVFKRGGNAV